MKERLKVESLVGWFQKSKEIQSSLEEILVSILVFHKLLLMSYQCVIANVLFFTAVCSRGYIKVNQAESLSSHWSQGSGSGRGGASSAPLWSPVLPKESWYS